MGRGGKNRGMVQRTGTNSLSIRNEHVWVSEEVISTADPRKGGKMKLSDNVHGTLIRPSLS